MKIRFLGTSSGAPTLSRNVSGLAVGRRNSKAWYLVDCGDGTQRQILRAEVTLAQLQAVFITHVHGDHCYGLPGLLASASLAGRTRPLTLVGPRAVARLIEAASEFTGLHLAFEVVFLAVDESPLGVTLWQDEGVSVEARALSHRVPSFAYAFREALPRQGLDEGALQSLGVPRGPLWGDLLHGQAVTLPCGKLIRPEQVLMRPARQRCIVVAGDNDRPDLLAGFGPVDAWVHEATYTEDVLAKVGSGAKHSTAARVADAARMSAVPHVVLTHFSPRYKDDPSQPRSLADVQAEARSRYQGALFMAHDGDSFELDAQGVLTQARHGWAR